MPDSNVNQPHPSKQMTDLSETSSQELAKAAERLRLEGSATEAGKLAQRALLIADATSGSGWHLAYRCLGAIAWSAGDLHGAANYYDLALQHRRRETPRSLQGLVAALDDAALVEYYRGFGEAALAHRQEALELATAEEGFDPQTSRRLRRRLGQSLHSLGYFDQAEATFSSCQPEPGDSVEDKIGWLNAMALVTEDKGNIAESAKWFDELIDLLDITDRAEGLAAALGNAIQTRLELGHEREAAVQIGRLHRMCRTDRKLASWLALDSVRIVHLIRRARYAAALRVTESSEQRFRTALPKGAVPIRMVVLKCALLRHLGKLGVALELARKHLSAFETLSDDGQALLVECGHLQLLGGNFASARANLTKALSLDAGRQSGDRKWSILSLLADLAHALGKNRAGILFGKMALVRLHSASGGLSDIELQGWLQPRIDAYTQILNGLTLAGRDPEAVQLQLRRPAQVSLDGIMFRHKPATSSQEVFFRPGEARIWDRYQALCETRRPHLTVDAPATRPGQDDSEIKALLDEIFEERFDQNSSARLDSMEFPVAGPYPLLAFLPSGDGLRGVFSCKETTTTFDVPIKSQQAAEHIRAMRQALQYGGDGWFRLSRVLYDALVRPVESLIAGHSRIDVLGTGMIAYLPFAVLHDGDRFIAEAVATSFRTGQCGSGDRSRFEGGWAASAFAPVAQGIPNAVEEAEALIGRIGGHLHIGEEFTFGRLQAALARRDNLVHLATHFVHEPVHPHRSRMLLGNGQWLTLAELAGAELDLNSVELLVLSGCDTGMSDGHDLGIEGLAGLMQSRGARHVLATLWKVPDHGARDLMSEFYRVLQADPSCDPVIALARAQTARIHSFTGKMERAANRSGIGAAVRLGNPGDWAGFVAFTP